MTLRARLTVVVAAAVALAVLVAVGVAWLATEHRLRAEIDDSLATRAQALAELPAMAEFAQRTAPVRGEARPRGAANGAGIRAALVQDISIQVVGVSGTTTSLAGSALPVGAADLTAAADGEGAFTRDATVDGAHFRVRTQAVEGGGAVQVGRAVTETDDTLGGLAVLLGVTALLGVAAAAVVGLVVAKRALRPIDDLTRATERVARDQDLTAPLPAPTTHDEVGRLTESFNTMLAALATSREQQQRLVTDASHELRTPLTSLRTTIELLRRADPAGPPDTTAAADVAPPTHPAAAASGAAAPAHPPTAPTDAAAAAWPGLPAAQRRELYDHALDELSELTHLATELVDLATDAHAVAEEAGPVDLGRVADRVAARARRRTGQSIAVTTDDYTIDIGDPRGSNDHGSGDPAGGSGDRTVVGHAAAIERAVTNLVDNACKWNPLGETIEVTVTGGRVAVADHGPGVAPEERERVFERFARGADAQAVPGSGLGLAIVRQVAADHGGRAWIEAAPGGGTVAVAEFSGDSQGP